MCYSMFVENQDMIATVMPQYRGWRLKLLVIILSRVLRLEMWGHGIGRHSSNDIWHIGKEDIGALSNYLGERMFFLGDKPHEVDCALFGMLAQIIYHMPGSPHEKLIKEKHYNLSSYCDRMKDLYWPDWNERCYNVLTPKDDMGKIYFSY
ncbi:hypothetical protein SNE40_013157 [Patella caerulea]|uniref:Metaxin glutathione S-transferase domain-containing protein n=1 Tax=Patella caerulea TaxID=87958 RepID=A0AAN8PT98_PATCE